MNRWKMSKCNFSPALSRGKVANASLPPIKLMGGLSSATFPPLREGKVANETLLHIHASSGKAATVPQFIPDLSHFI